MNIEDLLINLYNKKAVQEIEQLAITSLNISKASLIEKAANASVDVLLENFPNAKKITVFCGVGNNAEDGIKVAEKLQLLEKSVRIIKAVEWQKDQPIDADVIVDALFGIGINRDVTGVWAQIIEQINNSNIPVLSLDIPSGLDPDTGKILGISVKAKITVTFIALKKGLFTGQARSYCGEVKFNNLGLPADPYQNIKYSAVRLIKQHFKNILPKRNASAHKGDFGKILIIGGKEGMQGAPLLAGRAALRTGAGMVYVLANNTEQHNGINYCPEILWQNFVGTKQLKELLEKATVIVLGPGLGQDKNSKLLFDEVMQSNLPIILDADGLNILSEKFNNKFKIRKNLILTPHPKEAARLLQVDVATIEADRFLAATQLAQKFKATVVLKGAGTIITTYQDNQNDQDKKEKNLFYLCDLGNPGMATAGMGDVLTGVIAALVAQHLSVEDAAKLGVFVHAIAADFAAKENGAVGMVASDLSMYIRRLINTF